MAKQRFKNAHIQFHFPIAHKSIYMYLRERHFSRLQQTTDRWHGYPAMSPALLLFTLCQYWSIRNLDTRYKVFTTFKATDRKIRKTSRRWCFCFSSWIYCCIYSVSYIKGSNYLWLYFYNIYIYIYMYVCVCVCMGGITRSAINIAYNLVYMVMSCMKNTVK